MDNKDDNLREMEKIYEEQQKEYEEDKKLEVLNRKKEKDSFDRKVAFGIRIVRMVFILIIIFFVVKYQFKLLDQFEDTFYSGIENISNEGPSEEVIVNEIKLIGPESNMKVGDTFTLTVVYTPENTTDKSVEYISSDPDIVEVGADGKIVAKSEGTAKIIGITKNKKQATVTIIVE